ncbi:MAG: hypothetical protein ACXWP5_15015 [Bdellovibrionota bacterium]
MARAEGGTLLHMTGGGSPTVSGIDQNGAGYYYRGKARLDANFKLGHQPAYAGVEAVYANASYKGHTTIAGAPGPEQSLGGKEIVGKFHAGVSF